MSDATISGLPLFARVPRTRRGQVDLPAPQPFSAPILMMDAVTPLADETVLSLLWKRLERDEDR